MDLEDKSQLPRQDATVDEGILPGSVPEQRREQTHSPSPVQRQESYELATSDGVGVSEIKRPLDDYDPEAQDGRAAEVPHGILKKPLESDHGLPDDGLVYPEVEVKEGGGTKLVSLWTLFRYSTALDRLMVVIGVILSLAAGVALPVHMLLFGEVINQFVFYTQAQPLISVAESLQGPMNRSCDRVIDELFRPGFLNSTMMMDMGGTMMNMTMNMTQPQDALLCSTSPDLVFSIFDYICDSGSRLQRELGLYSAYYVALATGVLIASFIATLFLNVSAYRQGKRIRLAFYRAILRQDIGWFDVVDSAQLNTRLADDIDKVQAGIGDKVGVFAQYLATFITGYIIAFTISWKMTLVVGSLLPFMAFLACAIALLVASFALRESTAYAAAGAVAEEVISSIRTVVAFGGEQKETTRYGDELGKAWGEGIKKAYAVSIVVGLLYFIIFAAYALGFWYGSTLIIDCEIVAGDVSTVLFTVLIASFSLGSALPELQTFATALGSATSIFEVIDRQPLIDSSSEEGEKPAKLEGNIEFSDVVFHYPARPDVQILNGLDLKIKRGQTVALVGPSGCGKSTTMQLIQRFYNSDGGLITVDGIDIKSLNVRWLRNQIGIVSQEPILFNATIGENIRYGKEDATMADVEKAARNSNIHDFISQLPEGYDTHVGERGAQLSGGQKQRIAIARALVTDPKILLLDEATSALDTESEKTVQVALDKAKEGRTTIVIAHRLSTIQTANVIVALDKGRVVEMGTHDELLASEGLYYDLVTAQTIAEEDDKSEEPLAEFKSAVRRTSMKRQETILEQEGRLDPPSLASLSFTRPSVSLGRPSVSSQGRPSVSSQGRPSLVPPRSLGYRSLAPPKPLRKLMSRVTLEDIPLAAHPTPFPGREGFPTLSTEPRDVEQELDEEGNPKPPDEDTAIEISWIELLKLNKDDWVLVIVGVVTSAMIGVLLPCMSILFSEMLAAFGNNDADAIEDRVNVLVGGFIVLAVGAAIIYFLSNLALEYAGENLTKRLRYSTFKAMLRQNIGWFDERAHSTGALTTRLAVDVSEVKGATGLRLSVLLQAIASFITAVIISFIATWELSFIMLVVFPLLGGFSYLQLRFIITQSQKNKQRMEESGQIAVESIENIRTVAGLGVEEKTFLRYSKKLEGPFRTNIQGTGYQALVFAVAQSITFYTYAVGISFGAFLVIQGRASFNDIFQVFGAMIFTAQTVGRAFSFAPDASKGKVSAARILALIKKTPPIDSESNEGLEPNSTTGTITAGNLHFHYPTRPEVKILQGLTISVKPGQTLALVGPSGCGKSTIISLIERFYDPLEGVLKVDGHDVKDFNLHWLRSQIGLVGQEPILFDASIGDNIRYGANFREVSDEEIIKAAKSANIHSFIDSLPQGYGTNVGSKGAQLSGGQKQRIAIARAMVRDPKILLLDEATSALDTESERIVQEALDKAREGRTTITIAHRLSTIYTSNCIAVIHKGQVLESGTHSELMDLRGAYYHLNTVQLQDDE